MRPPETKEGRESYVQEACLLAKEMQVGQAMSGHHRISPASIPLGTRLFPLLPTAPSPQPREEPMSKRPIHGDFSTSAYIPLLRRGSLSPPLSTKSVVFRVVLHMTNADHRPPSSAATPRHSVSLRLSLLIGMKDARPTPLTGFLLEWFRVGTWQSLNVSEDLKYDVGRRLPLGHLLALCPQANPCTSQFPCFAICQ